MHSKKYCFQPNTITSNQLSRLGSASATALILACITAGPLLLTAVSPQSAYQSARPTGAHSALFAQTAPAKKDPQAGEPGTKKADGKTDDKNADGKKDEPTQAPAARSPQRESVWALIKKGGWTMVGLFLMSTIIVAFAAERFFFFRSQKVSTDKKYFTELESALEKGGPSELRKQLKDDDRLISRILSAGLAYENEGAARVEKAIENSASVEVGNLERGLNLLSNLGNLAPLLGFFGTVVGMRVSFLQFVEKAAPTARDLAGGVEEALITTAAGLLIAIPTYLAHNLFIFRIDSFNIELERAAAAILERFKS